MKLPASLKGLIARPTFAARKSAVDPTVTIPGGRAGKPGPAPRSDILAALFERIASDAGRKGIGWGEWLSISTVTLFTLDSPGSLRFMHRFVMHDGDKLRPLAERVERACLMREAGLECIGFIGIPKTINNLAVIRGEVDKDTELAGALPAAPRRVMDGAGFERARAAGNWLWENIYQEKSERLKEVLSHSHPDLGVYIINHEYGPLFSPPHKYSAEPTEEPSWEVNRLRTSLTAMSSLRAQGGVGPQVTSHVYGLLRARQYLAATDETRRGLEFLTTLEGAQWVLETVDEICRVVDGCEPQDREPDGKQHL